MNVSLRHVQPDHQRLVASLLPRLPPDQHDITTEFNSNSNNNTKIIIVKNKKKIKNNNH